MHHDTDINMHINAAVYQANLMLPHTRHRSFVLSPADADASAARRWWLHESLAPLRLGQLDVFPTRGGPKLFLCFNLRVS